MRISDWSSDVCSSDLPFMKRITWWPQAWLGLVFSWGALVGWIAVGGPQGLALPLLYAGCIAWVIGYDTIYALQDIEADMLIGVKSSSRAMGSHVKGGVAIRSEDHTSELHSLMRISYAVFCLNRKAYQQECLDRGTTSMPSSA